MPDQAMIDALIAGYRELNHKIRGANLGTDSAGMAIAPILTQMRDRELTASQAIKRLLVGEEAVGEDEPAVLTPDKLSQTSPNVLLSQFGTAREATLSQVREAPDEIWNTVFKTPRGEMSLKDYLQTLIDRDRQRIQEIDQVLSKAGV